MQARCAGRACGDASASLPPPQAKLEADYRRELSERYGITLICRGNQCCTDGKTIMRGIGEMRVKESDRIALMAAGLSACGIGVEEEAETLTVVGAKQGNHLVAGGAKSLHQQRPEIAGSAGDERAGHSSSPWATHHWMLNRMPSYSAIFGT